jgi:hypothetical protein
MLPFNLVHVKISAIKEQNSMLYGSDDFSILGLELVECFLCPGRGRVFVLAWANVERVDRDSVPWMRETDSPLISSSRLGAIQARVFSVRTRKE